MPHYLRFVRALALGSALAAGACDDSEDPVVDADVETIDGDIDATATADAAIDADIGSTGEGPLPPPELPVRA